MKSLNKTETPNVISNVIYVCILSVFIDNLYTFEPNVRKCTF